MESSPRAEHTTPGLRRILHVDMDAFFASVEQRDNPELKGQPVIVGGAGPRGVVAAASYEVRRFGVYSAMPVRTALTRCPHAVVVAPRMAVYQAVSRDVFAIFKDTTPDVEGLSLDEAFLDVTGNRLLASAREIAERLRQRIRDELSLTASVGIAPNKYLAKLASDHCKPDGLFEVDADAVQAFLDPLPIKAVWGLGKVSCARLERAGIHHVRDLRLAPSAALERLLGRRAEHFRNLARGYDERPVATARQDKSMSAEVTFDVDVRDRRRLEGTLLRHAETVAARLRRSGYLAATVTVKLRRPDFRTFTRQRTLAEATADTRIIYATGRDLFLKWWDEQNAVPMRLLGLGVSGLVRGRDAEPDLYAGARNVDAVADQIRSRFGGDAVKRGLLIKPRSTDED